LAQAVRNINATDESCGKLKANESRAIFLAAIRVLFHGGFVKARDFMERDEMPKSFRRFATRR
jgi:hypothetical protein